MPDRFDENAKKIKRCHRSMAQQSNTGIPASTSFVEEAKLHDETQSVQRIRAGDAQYRGPINDTLVESRRPQLPTTSLIYPVIDTNRSIPPIQRSQELGTQTTLNIDKTINVLEAKIVGLNEELRLAMQRSTNGEATSLATADAQRAHIENLREELAARHHEMTALRAQMRIAENQHATAMQGLTGNIIETMRQVLFRLPQRMHDVKISSFIEQAKQLGSGGRFTKLFEQSAAPKEIAQNILSELEVLIPQLQNAVQNVEATENVDETIQFHIQRQTELNTEITHLQGLVHSGKNTAAQLQTIIDQLISDLSAVRDTNERLLGDRRMSEEAIRVIRHSMVMVDLQRHQLATQIEIVGMENVDLNAGITAAQANIERLQAEIGRQNAEATDLHAQNVNLANHLQQQQDQTKQQQEQLRAAQLQTTDLHAQNVNLANQVQQQQDHVQQQQEQIIQQEEQLRAAHMEKLHLIGRARVAENAQQEAYRLLGDAWDDGDGEPDNNPYHGNEMNGNPSPPNRLTRSLDRVMTILKWIYGLFGLWTSIVNLISPASTDVGIRITILVQMAREYDLYFGKVIRLSQRFNRFHMYLTADQLRNLATFLPQNHQSIATSVIDSLVLPLQYRDQLHAFLDDLPENLFHGYQRFKQRGFVAVSENINAQLQTQDSSPPVVDEPPTTSIWQRPLFVDTAKLDEPEYQKSLISELPTSHVFEGIFHHNRYSTPWSPISPGVVQTAHEWIEWSERLPASMSNHGRDQELLDGLRAAKQHQKALPNSYMRNQQHTLWHPLWAVGNGLGVWTVVSIATRITAHMLPATLGITLPPGLTTSLVDTLSGLAVSEMTIQGGTELVRNQFRLLFNPDAVSTFVHNVLPTAPQIVGVSLAAWYQAMIDLTYTLFGIGIQSNGDNASYYQSQTQLVMAMYIRLPIYLATFVYVMRNLLRSTIGNQRARQMLDSPRVITFVFAMVVITVFTDIVFNEMSPDERTAIFALLSASYAIRKVRDGL